MNPKKVFHSDEYLRINARRLEHLASLNLGIAGKSVLEVGAGIGDHSHFFIDRRCKVVITEVRKRNLRILKRRYPDQMVEFLDMEYPIPFATKFDIVHCYGTFYHLSKPHQALDFMSEQCETLFLETLATSSGSIELVHENRSPSQAYRQIGCRPSRKWMFDILREHFPFVYIPLTQPYHEEFPLDWNNAPEGNTRAIFIASRKEIKNDLLTTELIWKHKSG